MTKSVAATDRVVVRVRDASLAAGGGPVHVVVSGPMDVRAVADAVASGGGHVSVQHGRLDALVVLERLVDAAGRVGGAGLADPVGEALRAAVAAWQGRPGDLVTSAGRLPLSERPAVMGIVNVTPDSFSDGGRHDTTDAAVRHGLLLLDEGADLVDIGGESTRPGAAAVPEQQELDRVIPVIEALAGRGAIVSIDTTKAAVAAAAVAVGAAIVNDVSAGQRDPDMLATVAGLNVPFVAMHAQGTPVDMQDDPRYDDVVAEVFEFLATAVQRCIAAGIAPGRVLLDPGFGFGKTTRHNLELLGALAEFRALGRPILVGASRKAFLGAISGIEAPAGRQAPSVAAAVLAVHAGASIVRVHDVQATVEAVRVASAVRVGEPHGWASVDLGAATTTVDKEQA